MKKILSLFCILTFLLIGCGKSGWEEALAEIRLAVEFEEQLTEEQKTACLEKYRKFHEVDMQRCYSVKFMGQGTPRETPTLKIKAKNYRVYSSVIFTYPIFKIDKEFYSFWYLPLELPSIEQLENWYVQIADIARKKPCECVCNPTPCTCQCT